VKLINNNFVKGVCRDTNRALSSNGKNGSMKREAEDIALSTMPHVSAGYNDPMKFMQGCLQMFATLTKHGKENQNPCADIDLLPPSPTRMSRKRKALMGIDADNRTPDPKMGGEQQQSLQDAASLDASRRDDSPKEGAPLSNTSPQQLALGDVPSKLSRSSTTKLGGDGTLPHSTDDRGGVGGLDAMIEKTHEKADASATKPNPNDKKGGVKSNAKKPVKVAAAGVEKYQLNKPPPMGDITKDRPVFMLGKSKVYTSVANKCWRVRPDFLKYDNDKAFPWKGSPKTAWDGMLAYCRKPTIPKTWKLKDLA